MMQLKGEKSKNTERYKKAMGLTPGSTPLAQTLGMMPSERAAMQRAMMEANMAPEAPNILSKTESKPVEGEAPADEDSNDSDLEGLDDDDEFMKVLRAKRIQEMKIEHAKVQKYKMAGQGYYNDIKEDEFLPTLNGSRHCVVHFYHNDFPRCEIIHKHLDIIAKKHLETKIVKMDAEKAHFFTAKLQVATLPTIVTFLEGVSKSRLVGFEDLGGHDHFQTEELETWLRKRGMLKKTAEQEAEDAEEAEAELERRLNPIRVTEYDI